MEHDTIDPVAKPANNSVAEDHGCLPPWNVGDLPEPLPYSLRNVLRTIGPGAILLAGSIGSGEWIVGPLMVAQHGRGILWIATLAILLQLVFNLEAVRYTMYTGEPILTGIMRLRPGRWLWGPFYMVLAVAQLGAPAMAAACAGVIFAGGAGRVPTKADTTATLWLTVAVVVSGFLLLLSGKSVERMLERLSWFMVAFILAFLIIANIAFVPADMWLATLKGFSQFGNLPDGMNLLLLSTFAVTAGSGGLGNIAISNWFRDKGFGMGKHVGGIGGALAQGHVELNEVGRVFPITETNMRRWHTWWRYARLDQSVLWAMGCVLGMYLNVNLAAQLFPDLTEGMSGAAVGTHQAESMARQWQGFWYLALLNGFWILYSTHLGNTDVMVRTISDVLWAGFPRVRNWPVSRLYAVLLIALTAWGFYAMQWGSALVLLKILGSTASAVMVIGALQILWVNHRFLPRPLRPPLWRSAGLVCCALFYGTLSAAMLLNQLGWYPSQP